MKIIILHVLCEGQTEERFVKEILAPYLQQFNIVSKATILLTSRKRNKRGGMISYAKAKGELEILFKQNQNNEYQRHLFTTMFDYYALPNDFPEMIEAGKIQNVRQRVNFIEQSFENDINNSSFIPYIQLHEFEALLFVDIEQLKSEYPKSAKQIDKLKIETDLIGDPELINNRPNTAPSKRIIKSVEKDYHYNKVQTGSNITSSIGIESLMKHCLHFKEWIERIKEKSYEI